MNPGNLIPNDPPVETAETSATTPHVGLSLDRASLLVHVAADTPLAQAQAWLRDQSLTLDVEGASKSVATVGRWLEDGAVGARAAWRDPADHLVAGFTARFVDGHEVVVRPAPRRSVGPDLFALIGGFHRRFATLTDVWLRVHHAGQARPESAPFQADADAPVSIGETHVIERIVAALE
jgi:alkyldihydroxyacetonephosphate synthase